MRGAVGALESAGRAVPVAFAVLFIAFFTGDVWRMVNLMPWPRFVGTVAVLLAFNFAAAVLAARPVDCVKRETLPRSAHAEALEALCTARGVVPWNDDRLTNVQSRNLRVALISAVFGRLLLVLLLATATFAIVGAVAVGANVAGTFLSEGVEAHEIWLGMPWETLGVSVLLGAVAALTFGAGAIGSAEQRSQVVDDQATRLAQRVDEWRYYAPLATQRVTETQRSPIRK